MDDLYFLTVGSEQKGPYTFSQVQNMWRSGVITADTLYCQQGFDKWLPVSSLAGQLDSQAAPLSRPVPSAEQPESDKRILPAFLLCLFFGILGIHAFYAGRRLEGILYLVVFVLAMWPIGGLLLIVSAVCSIIDLIRIIIGAYKDGQGRKITKWT
jgi:TM2 domain-containing membrane protein YozV